MVLPVIAKKVNRYMYNSKKLETNKVTVKHKEKVFLSFFPSHNWQMAIGGKGEVLCQESKQMNTHKHI